MSFDSKAKTGFTNIEGKRLDYEYVCTGEYKTISPRLPQIEIIKIKVIQHEEGYDSGWLTIDNNDELYVGNIAVDIYKGNV